MTVSTSYLGRCTPRVVVNFYRSLLAGLLQIRFVVVVQLTFVLRVVSILESLWLRPSRSGVSSGVSLRGGPCEVALSWLAWSLSNILALSMLDATWAT